MKKFSWQAYLLFFPAVFLTGVFLIAGLSFGGRLFTAPVWKQNINLNSSYPNLFMSQGEAHLSVVPDQAEIILGVEITEVTVVAAQEKANQVINDLQSKLITLGVEKSHLKTNNYSLYPDYDWSNNNKKVISYTATTTLQITLTDFTLLNQALDLATTSGVNQIDNINFTLSESKKNEVRQEARKIAIEQAKAHAESLSSLTDINLGTIVNVDEMPIDDYYEPYANRSYAMNVEGIDGGLENPTNIEAGVNTYNYRVTLSYQIL